MMITRSQMASTSCMMWVDRITVFSLPMEVIEEEQEGGKEAAARITEEGDRGEWTGGGSVDCQVNV